MKFFLGSSYSGVGLEEILSLVNPMSPYGEKVKRRVTPTTSKKTLEGEYQKVQRLVEIIDKYPEDVLNIRDTLGNLKDVQPILSKAFKGLVLEGKDFFYLKQWLLGIRRIIDLFKLTEIWKISGFKINPIEEYYQLLSLDNEGPSFHISDRHNEKLGYLRKEIRKKAAQKDQVIGKIKSKIEDEYKVKFNIENSVKVSKFDTDTVGNLSECQEVYYYGESYSHIEFKLKKAQDILSLDKIIEDLKMEIEREEYLVRAYLSKELVKYTTPITINCKVIGKFDWTMTKAYYSREIKGTIPEITDEELVKIKGAKNPVLERALAKRSKEITPVNIEIARGVTVITGANMGGKSVTLKTLGLIVAMAQMGFLVPCERLEFSPREFIFFSQDEGQSIEDGLSTFGVEIKGIKRVLSYRKRKGLYLIDELARGTNPVEGGALALSIARYLQGGKAMVVMTTHFEDLITEEFKQLRIIGLDNLSQNKLKKALKGKKGLEAVEELMDFRLKSVSELGVPKEGLKIAELMGIPHEIIYTAKELITSEGRNNDV